ncbi:MAG: winged helix-turn-helix domain-containing protein [Candidatus Micrarchaeaceae archaeon]|jgi:predicted transcriptional regulator
MERIVIKFVERPNLNDQEKMIKWFCEVFGLSSEENPDSIEEQILRSFIDAAYKNEGLGSSELNLDTELARSTVIYHLNRFIDAGLLVKKGRKYYFRASEMSKAIEEIEYDINREMQRMLDTAKEFDKLMELSMKKNSKKIKGGTNTKGELQK